MYQEELRESTKKKSQPSRFPAEIWTEYLKEHRSEALVRREPKHSNYTNIFHLASNYRGFRFLYSRNTLQTLNFSNICTRNGKTCQINNNSRNFSAIKKKTNDVIKLTSRLAIHFFQTQSYIRVTFVKVNCLYSRTLLPPQKYHIILGQQ